MAANGEWLLNRFLCVKIWLKLTNSENLPLFVTATCEFSRFDDLTDDEGILI